MTSTRAPSLSGQIVGCVGVARAEVVADHDVAKRRMAFYADPRVASCSDVNRMQDADMNRQG